MLSGNKLQLEFVGGHNVVRKRMHFFSKCLVPPHILLTINVNTAGLKIGRMCESVVRCPELWRRRESIATARTSSVYFFTFDTLHEDLEETYRNIVGNHRVDTGV